MIPKGNGIKNLTLLELEGLKYNGVENFHNAKFPFKSLISVIVSLTKVVMFT